MHQFAIVLTCFTAGYNAKRAMQNISLSWNGHAVVYMIHAVFFLSWAVLAITGTFDRWAAKP